ncbi:hypothetical protein [Aulosira sp. FACHB-615]|uniref:hypothetical protein n=1 Tax=Aulosira sp. FACHB-615 TaxID=2692777 RepID=UPI00168842BA|nr:hypothetical protein [Aulosira sp. FACHB-615]MBD2487770.1 hypothetical protein [Aulosira sp. FACHB-615]
MEEREADNLMNKQISLFSTSQDKTDDELIEEEIEFINISARQLKRSSIEVHSDLIKQLARLEYEISEVKVRILITLITSFFKKHLLSAKYEDKKIQALITKFRDAGRRSAPWKPTSERVPGRPQDGADGNRRLRWLFEPDHKFYANEVDATLVEIKYFLQTLSMAEAPTLPVDSIQESFIWLLGHPIEPGMYLDPIQLVPIEFSQLINTPKTIQSGHLIPLDRGGRHTPDNTFLMLDRSNQIQGNQTLEELLQLMERVVRGYQEKRKNNK